jgi:hypothetical protein
MAGVPVENSSGTVLATKLTQTVADVGPTTITSDNDAGLVIGTRYLLSPETTNDYRLRVGTDTQMYNLDFVGTIIPQAHIQQNLTSFTATQAAGYLTLNAGASVTTGQGANIRTYRTFPMFGTFPIYSEFWLAVANPTATNAVTEWGFGYVSGVTAVPTDGAFFRIQSGGALIGVYINAAGSEVPTSAITTSSIPNRDGTAAPLDFTKTQHYVVSVHNDEVEFWINDILVARLAVQSSNPAPVNAMNQPIFVRTYNSGAASSARQAKIGTIGATLGSMNSTKPYSHIIAGHGGGAYQTQPGVASAQTATYANLAAPGAGAWTASTAPATNSLGGLWLSPAAVAVGSENDFPLFAYLNPVGTATLPGKTLYVTSVRVNETWVTATLGTVGTILTWAVACGSTASTLATVDAAATVGPRRIALGAQAFAATAAVGVMVAGLPQIRFTTPLVVPPGTYFHVIVRNLLNGTAAGQLRGSVMIEGYFE